MHILIEAEPGTIFTDCEGVQRKCTGIQNGSISREELSKGTNAELWAQAWKPLRSQRGWTVEWLPSHRSLQEALAAGMSQEDWHGNALADETAKAEARRHDLPAELLTQWAERQAANEAVWRLIAESQVAHLAARPRRHDGAAAKARKRKAPARPNRRVRARVAPARSPHSVFARAAEAAAKAARHATAVAGGQVQAADVQLGHADVQLANVVVQLAHADVQLAFVDVQLAHADVQLGHVDVQLARADVQLGHVDFQLAHAHVQAAEPEAAEDAPAEEAAHQPPAAAGVAQQHAAGPAVQAAPGFDWPVLPVVGGIHNMVAEHGPGGPLGWTKTAAGTLQCKWACSACGKKAGNSSRLLEVLRQPCGEPAGQCTWEKVNHITEIVSDRVACTRCGTTRQRYVHLSGQACPVRQCRRAAAEVPEGTAIYGTWIRTIQAMHAHQRAVQEPGGAAAAAAAAPAAAAGPAGGGAAAVLVAEGDGGDGPPPMPVPLVLRPFRSHVCVSSAQVEFCMRCMSKAPRYRVAAWRAECCDGDAPVAGVPKHILAAIAADRPQWPARHADRGFLLVEAASAHGRSVASMALRRPKRRQVVGRQAS